MTDGNRTSDVESNPENGHNRRDFLKEVTATAVSAGALTTAASAQAYDEIVVGAGETWTYSLSDGETFENYLVDISATGAQFQLYATGNDWVVRNVGIRGFWDGTQKEEPFIVQVPDANSTGLIENFYFADGTAADTYPDGPTGIYVGKNHAGHIDMVNLNIQGMPDNSVYASSPGDPPEHSTGEGAGGTVAVRDSYSSSPNPAGFRLGTDGSYCENCVMYANGNRGYWGFYEHTELIDCDVSQSGGADIVLGDSAWTKSNYAEVTATNTYWETETAHGGASTANIHGTSANRTPRTDPDEVDGVPLSAEQAASGDGSDGDDPSGEPDEVAEDFSHGDVPGTYDLDTGSFTTSSVRSTSDTYSLRADDDANSNQLILRDDMTATAGNTYELDVYFPSGSDNDMGFLFGAEDSTGWSDYTGYLGIFDFSDGEIRISQLSNGSRVDSAATTTTWPVGEWLTVELDYRDADSGTITMTASDASGGEVASVSYADTTHDDGAIGWYNWHAASDWYADSWFHVDDRDDDPAAPTVIEDFERSSPLAEYGGREDLFGTTSTAYEGSQALVNDGGTFGSLVSTSGLDEYPSRGDEVHFYVNNAADDNFAAAHLFAQAETDAPDGYTVGISGHGAFRLWMQEDGDFQQIASESLPASGQIDGWYRAEVWTDSTTVYADLYDDSTDELLASIQADDSTYSSGGIGFRSAGNGEVWDYVVRKN